MDQAVSVQIFFRAAQSESEIVDMLKRITGVGFDSIDVTSPDARGFVQSTRYLEGFEQGILVSVPSCHGLALHEVNLVEGLARAFETEVLLQSRSVPDSWLMVDGDGVVKEVEVRYLDDGIEVARQFTGRWT